MTVTRDVIYDLLPSYFSGDASADTRALVEQHLAADPELKKMAERFGKLIPASGGAPPSVEADRAKAAFVRARGRAKLQIAALIWLLAAVFSFAMMMFVSVNGRFGFAHPGLILGVVFSVCALSMWLMTFSDHPERWYASFTGDPTDAAK